MTLLVEDIFWCRRDKRMWLPEQRFTWGDRRRVLIMRKRYGIVTSCLRCPQRASLLEVRSRPFAVTTSLALTLKLSGLCSTVATLRIS